MGNCIPTTHRFLGFTRRRRVRKEPPTKVEERVRGRENREDTGSENSHSVLEFLSRERHCEKHEEIGERTNRMEEVKTSGKAVEEKVEEELESREDEDEDNECSSSMREFLMLEKLCEECVETEEKKNRIEEENRGVEVEEEKAEEEIESRDDDDDECSSSLKEFLMLERLCEEYEEAKQRLKRGEQERVEMGFKEFRGHQLSTIEEEDEDEEEDEEAEEEVEEEEEKEEKKEDDRRVRETGEECEHLADFHRGEEDKDAASGDSDHIQDVKLMSFEEFCGESFEVSPTFFEAIMEESRISQAELEKAHEAFGKSLSLILFTMNEVVGKLEKEWKGNEEGDTLSKQKTLRLKGLCEAE
nr:expressed protein [Hymenolepis microstoma]